MNRCELEARLKTAQDSILAVKAQLKELNERKTKAILKMAEGERRGLNRKTRELEQELEDQELIKVALGKGIKECVEKLEPAQRFPCSPRKNTGMTSFARLPNRKG